MLPYIIRRLLWTVFLLFVVSGLTFIIFYVMPTADPAALRAGKSPTPEAVATVRKTLGLDRPPLEQYASYMGDVFTNFDFGRSYVSSAEVRPLILSRLPNTLFLIVGCGGGLARGRADGGHHLRGPARLGARPRSRWAAR